MGEASEQLERDVRELRQDVDRVLAEMNDRLADATDLRKQTKRHPYATAGIGTALLAGAGALTYGIWMRSHGPGGTVWPLSAFESRSGASFVQGKVRELQEERMIGRRHEVRPRSEGPMKRILWAVLASAVLTLSTYLTRRLIESAWTRTTGEAPPPH